MANKPKDKPLERIIITVPAKPKGIDERKAIIEKNNSEEIKR